MKAVKSLTVQNTLRLGKQTASKSRKASAGATWDGKGPVLLYIAPGAHEGRPDLVEYVTCPIDTIAKSNSIAKSRALNLPGYVQTTYWER